MHVKEVNIKDDMPTVDEALRRLETSITNAARQKQKIFKVVHGYGSTGRGGKIRTAARKRLASKKAAGKIRDYIPGEEFSMYDAATQAALGDCFELSKDADYNRCNHGITVVIM